ncbi:MAG: hypothetical protein WCG14_01605 [Chlamydiia bacterium]
MSLFLKNRREVAMKGTHIFLILSVLILNGCNNSVEVREEYIYDGYDNDYYYEPSYEHHDQHHGHEGHEGSGGHGGGGGHHGH